MVGISVDPPDRNRAMRDKLMLPFSLLADVDGAAAHRYGVWDREGEIARPAIFVVDAGGVVRYAHVGADFADRPLDGEIHEALATLGPLA